VARMFCCVVLGPDVVTEVDDDEGMLRFKTLR